MKWRGRGERDNGIIYFDVDAIFFFGGGGFIGSSGYLGCVAFARRHVCGWNVGVERRSLNILYDS